MLSYLSDAKQRTVNKKINKAYKKSETADCL